MSAARDDVRRWFDGFAADYEEARYAAGNVYAYNLTRRREAILGLTAGPPRRVLDAGCGPGVLVEHLLAQGHDVAAVDLSLHMARRAGTKRHHGRGAAVGVGALEELGVRSASFDLVVSAGVVEYVLDDARALRELRRVLRPGGTAILSFPLARPTSSRLRGLLAPLVRLVGRGRRSPVPSREYRPGDVDRRLAAAGLRVIERRHLHFVFFPLDLLAPRLTMRLERVLRPALDRRPLGWLGKTYLVRAEAV